MTMYTVVKKCVAVAINNQGRLGDVVVEYDHEARNVGEAIARAKRKAFDTDPGWAVEAVFFGNQPNLVTEHTFTLCVNCGSVLTMPDGRRMQPGHFDSGLPSIPNTDSITWARCGICYSAAMGGKEGGRDDN